MADSLSGTEMWLALEWEARCPAAREADMEAAEKALGVRFSAEYRACLAAVDGGVPGRTSFSFSDPVVGEMGGYVDIFFGVGPKTAVNIVKATKALRKQLPKGAIPFGADPGGDTVCFDYKGSSHHPSVGYWHKGRRELVPLAPSLASFLSLLHRTDYGALLRELDDEESP